MTMHMPNSASFWASQRSWLDSQTTVTSRRVAQKAARWTLRGAHYMRNTRINASIIMVDPSLQSAILELIESVAPALTDAFDQHFASMAQRAFDEWPVDTGLSKSLITLEYTVTDGGETFLGAVRSGAPYSIYIRGGQKHSAEEKRKATERAAAIREAAKKAGKEHLLAQGRDSAQPRSGNKATGPSVVKRLLLDPAPAVAEDIGQATLDKVSR